MNYEDIKELLIEICCNVFRNEEISKDMIDCVDFESDLGMDSITFITLLVDIEDRFEIMIPDEMLLAENFSNIENIASIIFEQIRNVKGGKYSE